MMDFRRSVLTLVMAGGKGSRLEPLTIERAKPAVHFGGAYRIIDFALSNCINSDLRRILILTQYKSGSLDRHINQGWRFLNRHLDEFVDILPPQQRLGEDWYVGTADAVYQNIFSIEQYQPEHLLLLSGDHIYRMDYGEMLAAHIDSGAEATIACLPVSLQEASEFGVMAVNDSNRVIRFDEKPKAPQPMPTDPSRALASMGIYVFKTDFLLEQLCRDATQRNSRHDFGHSIIPSIIDSYGVQAYPFFDRQTGNAAYWRDVGTLDAYFDANMDLVAPTPELDLYDRRWPIRTYAGPLPPPKFVFADKATDTRPQRIGQAHDSIVGNGSIISGGHVERSVLSTQVRINSFSTVQDSILFPGVSIGRNARIRRAIIDKDVTIPEGMEIGFDPEVDRAHGFTISPAGIVAVPQMAVFNPN